MVKLHAAGEHTIAELAELFEVSRPTVYRVLERATAVGTPRSRADPQRAPAQTTAPSTYRRTSCSERRQGRRRRRATKLGRSVSRS
ncbi:helix-turn-helix domain-containing protein [Micromonospora sp. NBC_01740]|uniref:helix-turn-helix domain-containing protein n=1 Tax=unclassified Micromonospora TaxID=2617518 RepID=UPI001CED58C8|nr:MULTISPECIES: helix-turn-helix domain-containing protein [unclassified Micromonospora]WSG05550.1 helix-turn-helix domain-containing protein [Micromonospora sp. NBC_01740]